MQRFTTMVRLFNSLRFSYYLYIRLFFIYLAKNGLNVFFIDLSMVVFKLSEAASCILSRLECKKVIFTRKWQKNLLAEMCNYNTRSNWKKGTQTVSTGFHWLDLLYFENCFNKDT